MLCSLIYDFKVVPAEMTALALPKNEALVSSTRDVCLCTAVAQCIYFYMNGSSEVNKPQTSCTNFVFVTHVTY